MSHRQKKMPMGPIVSLLALALATVIFLSLFEIKAAPPNRRFSAKAQNNQLLALERWLEAEGKSVYDRRPFEGKALLSFEADSFIIDARSLDEKGVMLTDLLARVRQGDFLMLHSLEAGKLSEINAGLIASTGGRVLHIDEEGPYHLRAKKSMNKDDYGSEELYLHFDSTVRIDSEKGSRAHRMWVDTDLRARVAEFPLDKGSLVLCGRPVFMHNIFISMEKNALLTWDILGGGERFLFIRGDPPSPAVFGSLFDKGNPYFFLAAFALLLIASFWMQLAPFGKALSDTGESEGASFARWTFEGRFLRKHHCLDSLIEPWRRHLSRRLGSGLLSGPTAEEARMIGKKAGIAPESVLDLYTGPPTDSMHRFRQRMHTIHALVEKL